MKTLLEFHLAKGLFAVVSIILPIIASAAPFDLNGVATSLSSLAAYPDGITNSGSQVVDLTVTPTADETYAGVISGNIRLIKTGNTTRLTLTGANTYVGGTRIDGGLLIAGNVSACGDATKPVEITRSPTTVTTTSWCTLQIDVSGFRNPIVLPQGTTAPGYANNTFSGHSIFVSKDDIQIDSAISGGFFAFLARRSYTDSTAVNRTVFTGPITCTGMKLYANGEIHFQGPIDNSVTDVTATTWTYVPIVHFYSPQNDFHGTKIAFASGHVYAEADNVFRGATLKIDSRDGNMYARIFLQGHSVAVDRAISTERADSLNYRNGSAAHQSISGGNGTLAVMTMNGTQDVASKLTYLENLSLVWEPTGDFTYAVDSAIASTLTGPIVVKRGTFALGGGHKMQSLTNITVLAGATFRLDSAAGDPLGSGTIHLVMERGAKMAVPDGYALTVASVTYDGGAVAAGEYSANGADDTFRADWVESGVIVVPGGGSTVTPSSATWTGAESTAMRTAGNWLDAEEAPDLASGGLTATFAAANAVRDTATVSDAVRFAGLNLATPFARFLFTNDTSAALVRLGSGGMAVTSSEQRGYVFEVPVRLEDSQTWDAANATVLLRKPLSAASTKQDTLTLTGGTGRFEFRPDAPSTYKGSVMVKAETDAYGENPFGVSRTDDFFLTSGFTTSSAGPGEAYVGVLTIGASRTLRLHNVTSSKQFALNANYTDSAHGQWGASSVCQLVSPAGTTNEFSGAGQFHFHARIKTEAGAKMTFSGGPCGQIPWNGGFGFTLENYGETVFTGKPLWHTESVGTLKILGAADAHLRFSCPSNVAPPYIESSSADIGTIDLDCEDALVGKPSGYWFRPQLYNGTEPIDFGHGYWRLNQTGVQVVDVHGHDQHLGGLLRLADSATFRTDDPATVWFYQGTNDFANGAVVPVGGAFDGPLTIGKFGPKELVLKNAYAATGGIVVAEGCLTLASTASWRGATGIAITNGTLRVEAANAFGRLARVEIGEGGTLDLRNGARVRVTSGGAVVNGEVLPGGFYGSSECSRPGATVNAAITGDGTLWVVQESTTLFLR